VQLDLFKTQTIRSCVLDALTSTNYLISARSISEKAGVTYDQAIFALHALHNAGKIYRQGKKTTAMWGNLDLQPKNDSNYDLLERIVNGFARR
jgi:hypothetical protein